MSSKVLSICSGGLDSISMTLLHKDDDVTLLTFDYGQKATKEINVVRYLAAKYNMKIIAPDISSLSWIFGKENQLTNSDVTVEGEYKPSIVVPLRNGVFLQLALTYAYSYGFDKIILGSHMDDCQLVNGDYAFPDCTPAFFSAMEMAAVKGTLRTQKKVLVQAASTLHMHKKQLIQKAYEIDKDVLFKTWSCYTNGEKQCGKCDSCMNRKRAFKEAGIIDETEYLE